MSSSEILRPTTEAAAKAALAQAGPVVVHFGAAWCGPSSQMEAVVHTVPAENVTHVRVEAEDVPGLSLAHNVVSVPTFVVFLAGKEVARLEGANAPALVRIINEANAMSATSGAGSAAPAGGAGSAAPAGGAASSEEAAKAAAKEKKKLERRMQGIIDSAPVVLFMKGEPSAPQCGFSRKAIGLLQSVDVGGAPVDFASFDILSDPAVRQGLKTYSNWPTFPQLYISGKLVGGLDIMAELAEDDELAPMIAAAYAKRDALNARLAELIASHPVMVFIKGTPDEPRCGFSRKMVTLLNSTGITYGSFDILSDDDVRQGLKTYSNWPTFPQLYAHGKLIGGNDIAHELAEDGELEAALAPPS
ncbi:glutaredoxin 3 [Thecamonas trahens ATCC 50062]|uniref:Glutaredoxin 3 n=1 Tax=Thecamonas trahens ATCC 50062 TaxID=461836 RepID=A0A0L0DB88_THETB|nr:glutaredoxin 3 [Thecamonas trahens ATCC 50062]KNC49376.1 glutaredoxin 3 [Thecamonas trahens ATCC 50062]|eukprot:XP_013757801.1 glutaredoxin 3 [Thecamonas trahens ATCC 50062]